MVIQNYMLLMKSDNNVILILSLLNRVAVTASTIRIINSSYNALHVISNLKHYKICKYSDTKSKKMGTNTKTIFGL